MESTAGIFLFIGFVICLVYGIKILIMAFQKSILWGLASLFIPLVQLVFIILYWSETKSPFLRGLLGIPFILVGLWLSEVGMT